MRKFSFLSVLTILLSGILRADAQICGREGDTCYFFACCEGFECAGSFSKACKLVEGEGVTTDVTTGGPDDATESPEPPTTTEHPEKVVYTTIRFVTKEYLMSNFPGAIIEDSDNSTEVVASTTSLPSEGSKPSDQPSEGSKPSEDAKPSDQPSESTKPSDQPSVEPSVRPSEDESTTTNTQASHQTEKHPSVQRQNGTIFHNSTQQHSNDTQLHSNHTSGDHNSTHIGGHSNHTGIELPSNHTGHSNHTGSSSASSLSSYYFLLYLPLVTTMWYLV